MKAWKFRLIGWGSVLSGASVLSGPVLACATCFGASDDPLAKGMNMGIAVLLVMITSVLSGIVGFGVFVARRAGALEAEAQTGAKPETEKA